MVYGGSCGFTCQSQCPPHQMCVQPPPFYITVPGPMMSCSNDTLAVECNNPCGYGCGGWGGYGGFGYGGYGGYGGNGGYGGCRGYGGLGYGGYGGNGGYGGCRGYGGYGQGGCGWGVSCGTGYGIRG